MPEFYFQVDHDDINKDGSRESDLVIRAIGHLFPEAVWEKYHEGWRIIT